MQLNSNEVIKLEKTLNNFLFAIQNNLKKNKRINSNQILNELEKLNSKNLNSITASRSPTSKYLESALDMIPNTLDPMDKLTKIIAKNVMWNEAERGVPEFFKGGYAFAEIVGEMGFKFSEKIRLGFFLQKPNLNYPLHAHDAKELYFILSGSADWEIEDKKFKASPGLIIHHEEREEHAMTTSELPLFALWIWTGNINGRYWFAKNPDKDCPI